MKCDKVQEFLFTDYIDGLADKETEARIDEHIAGCPKCREVKEAIAATRASLKSVKREGPPGHIWYRLKEAILSGKQEERPALGGILGTLKNIVTGPRYVFARATAVALVILVLVFAAFVVQRNYMTTEMSREELYGLVNFELNGDEMMSDLGTEIEKYFL
jgi:anti-sigma factor RsiW